MANTKLEKYGVFLQKRARFFSASKSNFCIRNFTVKWSKEAIELLLMLLFYKILGEVFSLIIQTKSSQCILKFEYRNTELSIIITYLLHISFLLFAINVGQEKPIPSQKEGGNSYQMDVQRRC